MALTCQGCCPIVPNAKPGLAFVSIPESVGGTPKHSSTSTRSSRPSLPINEPGLSCAWIALLLSAVHWGIIMFAIIGIVVVFGAVVGGYLMVLLQPAELLIIGGAGAGTVLIANPLHILKQIAAGIGVVFKGSKFTKQRYMESLKIAYELLNKARRQGLMSLESDVETPEQSPIFSKDPEFLKDHHVRHFFCDSMRMAISGMEAFELDQLMDLDLEVHHHEATQPVSSLSTMADSLPGLGIVAAVLGVVITMG